MPHSLHFISSKPWILMFLQMYPVFAPNSSECFIGWEQFLYNAWIITFIVLKPINAFKEATGFYLARLHFATVMYCFSSK